MRRMTKFVHGTAGSISIFLLIIIFCFVALGGLLIDGIRVRTAKQRLELAAEAAADSVLAEYSSKLANEYGILAYTGKEDKSTARAKDVVETYTSGVEDTFSMAILENVEVTLETGNILNPTVDKTVLIDQLLENSKYTGVYTFGKGIMESLGFFEKNGAAMESFSDMVDKQDEIKKLIVERNKILKEVETKTGGIKALKNKVEEKKADLESKTFITRCAESCLEEILVGSETKGLGPLSSNLKNLESKRDMYLTADDPEMVALYEGAISIQESLIKVIKNIDKTATESLKGLRSTFEAESKKTDEVMKALDEISEKIEEGRKKNEEIIKIIGDLKESEETKEIKDALGNTIMKDQDFPDMKQKISDVKEEYKGYQSNVKIIERGLKNAIGGIEKIARPALGYTHIESLDMNDDTADKLQKAFEKDKNKVIGYLVANAVTQFFPEITGAFKTSVETEQNHNFEQMVKKITDVNSWAKDKEYKEDPSKEVKDQEEQYKTDADKSFTEILDVINDLEGVANDQAIYDELRGIVTTMQDISADTTEITTESQEKMYEQSNNLLKKLLEGIKSLGDRVLINEYLLNEVGSKQPKDLLEDLPGNMQYENKKLEFVMYGQYVSGANYALSMGEIILIRLLMNTIGAMKDHKLDVFKPFPLIYLGVVLASAVINTSKDIITLGNSDDEARKNRDVELIPNVLKKIRWTYKDHLRFMLLYHPRGGQYERLVAVMEKDTGIEGVASKPTQVKVESSAQLRLWFLPAITKSLAGEGGVTVSPNELKLKTVKFASY